MIATAAVSDPLIAERLIKRVRKKLKKKERNISEFKFSRKGEKGLVQQLSAQAIAKFLQSEKLRSNS